mmetsp:Transcript_10597/g.17965  ORF Transcript_10597/g.17965 Transcript_10597/m.17965 type:complete len:195 (+) Transcript_10597:158-742(+)|eukprot:CAMPEP_0171730392 /NCGR_PEP_ID=MMETSP0991-20121206/28259_1 /TAXON_ID=483369 /ORGANISM="non described non described, Strain CCMP2098" /LENGTH=194 /DNA_ID=CAMNT_0012325107 /DNA_START=279 /DNA_END=863 /DNA_ORIENTATION=+
MNALGLVERERAATVTYELALQRSQLPLNGCSGRDPCEHGKRNSGHLTLPGWGRVDQTKRKRQAENEESKIYQRPSSPLPHMTKSVSVSSISELEDYLTTQEAVAESGNGRTENSSDEGDAKKANTYQVTEDSERRHENADNASKYFASPTKMRGLPSSERHYWFQCHIFLKVHWVQRSYSLPPFVAGSNATLT